MTFCQKKAFWVIASECLSGEKKRSQWETSKSWFLTRFNQVLWTFSFFFLHLFLTFLSGLFLSNCCLLNVVIKSIAAVRNTIVSGFFVQIIDRELKLRIDFVSRFFPTSLQENSCLSAGGKLVMCSDCLNHGRPPFVITLVELLQMNVPRLKIWCEFSLFVTVIDSEMAVEC